MGRLVESRPCSKGNPKTLNCIVRPSALCNPPLVGCLIAHLPLLHMATVSAPARFQMPASSEVEDFTDQVDEACRLIAGLQAGSVSPEEFDRREAVKVREAAAKEAKQQAERPVLPEETTERQQQLKQKIAELQNNQQKKQKARQRYNDHVSQQSNKHVTDYTKWDFFTPDDEDDDLINSLTPNNPQLKAMEVDIDARHARLDT
jgi:flagellar motor protein MotB